MEDADHDLTVDNTLDACLSMLSAKHTQQTGTTWQLRRFVGRTTSG
jgi:hypothetical protein